MKKVLVVALVALNVGFTACEDVEEQVARTQVIEDSQPSPVHPAKGFYVANEDWLGHDDGTVNYFKANGNDYEAVYRAYRAANEGEKLGVTTQFGTTWGNYIYLVSKQGNRLVVADANTLKKRMVFTEIGGDGRYFVGVDDQMGYVGHSKGIRKFDIAQLQLGDPVAGISDQIGAMCYAEGRVFALAARKIYIIDVATNTLEKTLTGSYNTLTRSKDGTVWIATASNFLKVDPKTLKEETLAYPGGVSVASPWFAWNAGSLCASTQNNVIYWAKGTSWSSTGIVKYDIDTQTFTDNLYTLGKSGAQQQVFYGAGFRVDPITDKLIATFTRDGYGENYSYNWIAIIRPDGNLEKEMTLTDSDNKTNYYWFPSVPFFEDANAPEILINQIYLKVGEKKTIDLNQKVIDADNTSASIIRRVTFADNSLVTYTFEAGILTVTANVAEGSTTCKVVAISNGKRIEKEIRVDVVAN